MTNFKDKTSVSCYHLVLYHQCESDYPEGSFYGADVRAMVRVTEFPDGALGNTELLGKLYIGHARPTHGVIEGDLGGGYGLKSNGNLPLFECAGKGNVLAEAVVASESRHESVFGHEKRFLPCSASGISSGHIWKRHPETPAFFRMQHAWIDVSHISPVLSVNAKLFEHCGQEAGAYFAMGNDREPGTEVNGLVTPLATAHVLKEFQPVISGISPRSPYECRTLHDDIIAPFGTTIKGCMHPRWALAND